MKNKQLKLKPEERRCAPREELQHKPKGVLQTYTKFRNFDVLHIRDISPFGLCLLLNHPIDRDMCIQLKYICDDIQIEVTGTVVWRNPVKVSDSHSIGVFGCWVGIFLHPSDIDANFALYQTLMEGTKPKTRGKRKPGRLPEKTTRGHR